MSEKKRTSFYLDTSIIKKLRELAGSERRSMSAQVEMYVDEHWRARQRPTHTLVEGRARYDAGSLDG